MLVLENIAKLVTYALGVTDCFVNIPVGVAIYPIGDSTAGNEITQLCGKCAINTAVLELRRHQFKGWNMMRSNNNFGSL